MPRQSKCSYCRNEGHNISKCDSERGNTLFNYIRSRAIDYIVLDNRSLHERTILFYEFLIDILYVDELKLILSKKRCRINGNKTELAARFVYRYFIQELAYGPYLTTHMDDNERDHVHIYGSSWELRSENSLIEANQQLDRYFRLIEITKRKHKFPINVVMKTTRFLTKEQLEQYFECAICMEENVPIVDQVELGCHHSFCTSCIGEVLKNSKNNKKKPCCALCRADFKTLQLHRYKIMEEYKKEYCYSC
jgi:hypothetical protein